MGERPWYRRFPSNFIHGTIGYTLEQRGAYSTVLDMIYDRGGPIHDDAHHIAGVLNCSVRKWGMLRTKFIADGKLLVLADGRLMNPRADKEIAKAVSQHAIAQLSGKKARDNSKITRGGFNNFNGLRQMTVELSRDKRIEDRKRDYVQSVDRQLYPRLFAACEAATGVQIDPEKLRSDFDMDVIGEAVSGLGGKWC